jgi:hypothetical protein
MWLSAWSEYTRAYMQQYRGTVLREGLKQGNKANVLKHAHTLRAFRRDSTAPRSMIQLAWESAWTPAKVQRPSSSLLMPQTVGSTPNASQARYLLIPSVI